MEALFDRWLVRNKVFQPRADDLKAALMVSVNRLQGMNSASWMRTVTACECALGDGHSPRADSQGASEYNDSISPQQPAAPAPPVRCGLKTGGL